MQQFKLYLALGILFALTLVSGCHVGHHVIGSGNRQTQKRDIPTFTKLNTEGAFEIEINSQKPVSLEIEADDNILPLISAVVSNDVLTLKNERGYSGSPVKIRLSVPNLEGLSVLGAGKVNITGLKNEKFEIDANGASVINVSGETALMDIECNGAGYIDAHKLRASKAVVESRGVSAIQVFATDQLDVTVSGPSTVTYEGTAKVSKTIHGPGSVEKKESGPS